MASRGTKKKRTTQDELRMADNAKDGKRVEHDHDEDDCYYDTADATDAKHEHCPPALDGCPTQLTDDQIRAMRAATEAATSAGLGVEWVCFGSDGSGCRRRSHFMRTTCPGCGRAGSPPIFHNGAWGYKI